ncbi:hypothetical protein V6615_15855 [Oscillospiraceae bacterium PP1C4]
MAKKSKWDVSVNGVNHEIAYKRGVFKASKVVDGEATKIKSKNAFIQLIDEPITIENKTMHLTAIGNKVDLAVDDVYLNSGKPYVPFGNIPGWANIMAIAVIIIGWFFAGIIGLLIGLFGAMFIFSKSISVDQKNPLPICLVVTILCAAFQVVFGIIIQGLLA